MARLSDDHFACDGPLRLIGETERLIEPVTPVQGDIRRCAITLLT
jgi:hypothetical protein